MQYFSVWKISYRAYSKPEVRDVICYPTTMMVSKAVVQTAVSEKGAGWMGTARSPPSRAGEVLAELLSVVPGAEPETHGSAVS